MASAAIVNSSGDAGNVSEIASDDFLLQFVNFCLLTVELFSELRIVRVLETALANRKGNFNNKLIIMSRGTSQCSNCERIRIKVRFLY